MSTFFVFFSSRRRHTRWPRDWSSDVCSSDLARRGAGGRRPPRGAGRPRDVDLSASRPGVEGGPQNGSRKEPPGRPRSEERRVGKEWRSRWSRGQWKNKSNDDDMERKEGGRTT